MVFRFPLFGGGIHFFGQWGRCALGWFCNKAIPALIAQLDGPQAVAQAAYRILINLQAYCPELKREVWEVWWRETGSALFDDMAK